MIPATAGFALDPRGLALAAVRLRALLPPAAAPGWEPLWAGWASRAAAAAAWETVAGYEQARLALAETADALAVTADALAAAEQLVAAAVRLSLAEPAAEGPVGGPLLAAQRAVDRLRGDADDQVARADAQCADRLRALLADRVPVLPPLVVAASPEQTALRAQAAHGWSAVDPALLGPLGALAADQVAAGIDAPLAAREVASRIVLAAAAPALLVAGPGGVARQYLQAGPAGQLAEVWGDPATAAAVVVLVPGTTTSRDGFAQAQQQGDALYATLLARAGAAVAVMSWLGSPEPPNLGDAALASYARRAAPLLRDFVQQLPLAAGARLTLVGHSYGGVVAGEAVRAGLRPAALVGVAPAGFGPQVHDAADLEGVPTYVLEDSRDPIQDEYVLQGSLQLVVPPAVDRALGAVGVGHLGDDPRCLPGAQELATADDDVRVLPGSADWGVHRSYFEPGNPALAQLAAVATGAPVAPAPWWTCATALW